MSKNSEFLKKWKENGNIIPECVNVGCNREVSIRHWSAQGDPSLKTECSRCSKARIKGKIIDGITFHKKNYCENKDNILGFKCPMDPERYAEFPSDIYDMDHKDGNHENNTLDNLITICKICHARKGKESGDFNSQKQSSRKFKTKTKTDNDNDNDIKTKTDNDNDIEQLCHEINEIKISET